MKKEESSIYNSDNISAIEQEEESSTNTINLKPTKELSNEA